MLTLNDLQLLVFLENFPYPNGSFSLLRWEVGSELVVMTEENSPENTGIPNLRLAGVGTRKEPSDFPVSSKDPLKDWLSICQCSQCDVTVFPF